MPPEALTRIESHDKVIKLLSTKKRGRILDIPCGHGALAIRLRALGFEVSCADIDTKLFEVDALEVMECNLNDTLPYDGNSFDYIACVAGIHRVHRLSEAIEEFNRILVPGGELIISFPNYATLERRIKFLLTGSISKSVDRMAFHTHYSEHADSHFRHLLLFPQIFFALSKAGFQITGVAGDKFKWKALCYFPFIASLWIAVRLLPKKIKNKYVLHKTSSIDILLGGNNLIVTAVKRQGEGK
jgi:SAM-dependent methyltransferase